MSEAVDIDKDSNSSGEVSDKDEVAETCHVDIRITEILPPQPPPSISDNEPNDVTPAAIRGTDSDSDSDDDDDDDEVDQTRNRRQRVEKVEWKISHEPQEEPTSAEDPSSLAEDQQNIDKIAQQSISHDKGESSVFEEKVSNGHREERGEPNTENNALIASSSQNDNWALVAEKIPLQRLNLTGATPGIVVPLEGQWEKHLCRCPSVGYCCTAVFCYPCAWAKLAMVLDENLLILLNPFAAAGLLRQKTRYIYGIQGSIMEDCLAGVVCNLCVLCQIKSQLEGSKLIFATSLSSLLPKQSSNANNGAVNGASNGLSSAQVQPMKRQ